MMSSPSKSFGWYGSLMERGLEEQGAQAGTGELGVWRASQMLGSRELGNCPQWDTVTVF